MKVLYPNVVSFAFAKSIEVNVDSARLDTLTIALLNFKKVPPMGEQTKIKEWIKARLSAKKVNLIVR